MSDFWRLLCWFGLHEEPAEQKVFREERDETFVPAEPITHCTVAYTCARCGRNIWQEWREYG